MNITPWRKRERSPAPLFRQEFEDIFSRFFGDDDWMSSRLPETFRGRRYPAIDLSENEQELTISAELPGLEEEDINLEIVGNNLILSGERKWQEEKKEKEFHRVEMQYGSFQRSLPLPDGLRLDPDAITAAYKKGILTVKIPKIEPTPPRKIRVQGKDD